MFVSTGMVASPRTQPEAAKPAQVTNIYINRTVRL